jgi:hypothetical protein
MTLLKMRTALCLFAFLFSVAAFAATSKATHVASWTDLAKKVGESEDNRASVIAQLRKIPGLKSKLKKAIYTKDRPLALDVISSLEMKDMIPDLLLHVPADPDGFLTVAINSMIDGKNQTSVLNSYQDALSSPGVSNAAVVAMLEPLGRLGIELTREILNALRDSASPEVRSSLVYYVRVMTLRNQKTGNLDILASLLKAPEFQIRLQTVSVSAEILALTPKSLTGVPSRSDLKAVCETEKTPSIKAACLAFIAQAPRVPASAETRAPMCVPMEKALYARDTLKVRMVFGYKDARPARFVGDRHERLAFIEHVTSPCAGDSTTCGFARSHDNADLFMKKLKIKGRDRRVLLWVVNSSVGTDDQENREDPFQKWKSKYAEEAFTTGLRDADVVLYDGHSRFGGGPDFTTPQLSDDGTVDPSNYQSARPGLTKMISALKSSVRAKSGPFSKLKILGLFSCSSSQHFNEEIHEVSKAGVVSSKVLMYYSDALHQSFETLGDVLSGHCPRGISF